MSTKDDLARRVDDIFASTWNVRDGRVVPATAEVALDGGGVRLDATVLYADLKDSSRLATEFRPNVAGKIVRSYLHCMCQLISNHRGSITSFDGDRVMAIFVGDYKNTNATKCSLKMAWAIADVVNPLAQQQFEGIANSDFIIDHCVGIDTSSILVVRAGQRGSNDLVWIGRAPNLAAKLSQIRNSPYRSYISGAVYRKLNDEAKYLDESSKDKLMWEKRSFKFLEEDVEIYRSSYSWIP